MSNTGSQDDKVRALEHEVRTLKREVRLLQSARTFKVATYGKRLLKSHPKDIAKNLKRLPEALKREHIPAIESTDQSGRSHFSSATRPSSLYRFPNINVAVVDDSSVFKFLYDTCSTLHYSDSTAELLATYEALQVIVINPKSEIDTTHLAKLLHYGQKVIILGSSVDVAKPLRSVLGNSTVRYVPQDALPPVIDIYKTTPSLELHNLDTSIRPTSLDDGTTPLHGSLNIISATKLYEMINSGDSRIITAIFAMLPAVIITSEDSCDIPAVKPSELDTLSSDIDAVSKQLIRQHSYVTQRYNAITATAALFDAANINYDNPSPTVGIMIATRRFSQLEHILNQVTLQDYPLSDIAIGAHGFTRDEIRKAHKIVKDTGDDRILLYDFSDDTLFGDVLNSLVNKLGSSEFIAKMDDDDYYGPHHISDLVIAQLYSDADIVGKWNNWVYFLGENKIYSWASENALRFTNHIPGGTCLIRTSLIRTMKFGKIRRAIDSELYRRAISRGALLYSTHRYNYVRVRHGDHTYQANPEEWKSRSDSKIIQGLDLEIAYLSNEYRPVSSARKRHDKKILQRPRRTD